MAAIPAPIRKLLRPLAPWRLRDRVRGRRLARQVRDNVDIAVDGRLRALRWLATSPATYRAGKVEAVAVGSGIITVPDGVSQHLAALISADTPVAAAAHTRPPSWSDRGAAAHFEPIALAATPEALADIGGSDADPVPALFDRLRQAGHRIVVTPHGRRPSGPLRVDAIEAPAAVVLSGVPLHDVGGGSRGAQLAMELLARGYHVAYVARFATWDSGDLGLRHIHPRLEQYTFAGFDASVFASRARRGGVAICELPVPEYAEMALRLGNGGFDVVYDLIDDWSDPALGLDWYQPSVEAELIAIAGGLAASASPLLSRLAATGRQVELVPNGVNERIFSGDPGERPADLPIAGPLLGYHGSLYGDWFDWEALGEVAEAFADGVVTVIGDARQHPTLPPNVRFLGVKAQFQLPAYVGRYDVGLVPFTVTATTHAVSPLKAFECLAMGVPVAGPELTALEGIEGVHMAASLVAAVQSALEAPPPDGAAARAAHGWGQRLGLLLGTVDRELPDRVAPIPRVELRPATTYRFADRLLR